MGRGNRWPETSGLEDGDAKRIVCQWIAVNHFIGWASSVECVLVVTEDVTKYVVLAPESGHGYREPRGRGKDERSEVRASVKAGGGRGGGGLPGAAWRLRRGAGRGR